MRNLAPMSDGPTIRDAKAQDAPAIAGLHADSWRRHYRGAYADAYLDGDLDHDRLAVWAVRLERQNPDSVTLLAESQGVVVGFAHAVIDHDPQWGSLIENLHVRHDRHRSGIGRRLLAESATKVREKSRLEPMHLWVLQQNVRAQAFYRAMGGICVESAACPPPGNVPERLHGSPSRLRFVWHRSADVAFPAGLESCGCKYGDR